MVTFASLLDVMLILYAAFNNAIHSTLYYSVLLILLCNYNQAIAPLATILTVKPTVQKHQPRHMLMETATSARAEPPIPQPGSKHPWLNIPHRYFMSTVCMYPGPRREISVTGTLRIREQTKLLRGDLYRSPSEQMWNNQSYI